MSINPLIALGPLLSIIIGVVPIIIFRPNGPIITISALAYFLAIVAKVLIELPSSNFILSSPLYIQAIFYGSLTAVFEVGFAFLFPLLFQVKVYNKRLAISYGAMLAFWENAVLLGISGLIQVVSLLYLQSHNPSLVQQAIHTQPSLAYSTPQLLPLIGFGALERVSSFLAHTAWGSLAYYYLFIRSKSFFLIALLGYIDAFVPLIQHNVIPLSLGEILIFVISLIAFLLAYKILPGK